MNSAFDDEDSERNTFVNINSYDDEDEDVLDCWEDVEDEEEKAEKERKAAEDEAKRKQLERDKRLAKREEERKKALEEEARLNAPSLSKADLEQAQRDSDAAHAADLFGSDTASVTSEKKTNSIDSYIPVVPKDFMELKKRLITKLRPYEKDEGFTNFVKELTQDLVLEMSSEEIRKVSTSLTNIAHEKGRLEREAKKKQGVNAKKSLKVTKKNASKDEMLEDFGAGSYGFENDEFDFM